MEKGKKIINRIGINGYFLTSEMCGSRQYIENILKYWKEQEKSIFTIQPYKNSTEVFKPIYPRNDIVQKVLYEKKVARIAARSNSLLWSPYHSISCPAIKHIMTIHDAIGYIPKWAAHSSARSRWYAKRAKRAAARATHILAPTRDAKRDIQQYLEISEQKITVIPNGINHELYKPQSTAKQDETKKQYHLPKKYYCYVGGFEQRKNIQTLIELFKSMPEKTLVVIGNPPDSNRNPMLQTVTQTSNIIIIRDTSDTQKSKILAAAHAFLWPSIKEGFGIPPLEAITCGTPVIALKATSTPEVLGNAAYWCNSTSIDEWSNAIEKLEYLSFRTSLIDQGIVQAKKYSWKATAEKTWNILQQFLNEQS